MELFIVRPFGVKNGIDFDRVDAELIQPAKQRLNLGGGTTGEILRTGNIRADMFELLAKADIVVADISIHNANVYYELGARHALRDKRTFLIRSAVDEVPFDLQTDRFLEYQQDAPGNSVEGLINGLQQTIDSPVIDSPIFQLVPNLKSQDWTQLIALPAGFREELNVAAANAEVGDLELLSKEAEAFDWASEGLRLVGRAQFLLGAWEGARDTWEKVRTRLEGDLEADLKLGTIFQKIGELAKSDVALDRAVASAEIDSSDAAEAYALKGSNEKTRWMEAWSNESPQKMASRALGSHFLQKSQNNYEKGFAQDLNHYFSGVNALALQVTMAELAQAHPDVWTLLFDDDESAQKGMRDTEKQRQKLTGAVSLSVDRKLGQLEQSGETDRWAQITKADVVLLTNDNPKRVALTYRRALEGAEVFYFSSVRRQLGMFQQLSVLTENVNAVCEEIDELDGTEPEEKDADKSESTDKHTILFTGHRIDNLNRPIPRFPADKESTARSMIHAALVQEQERLSSTVIGIAGGASGGDILFHEVCAELGIETQLYLAIPSDQYVVTSVDAPGNPQWIDRFQSIKNQCTTRVLSDKPELPIWLKPREDYSIWQRNNLWMLHNGLAFGGTNTTLMALWNGREGDGPGGTEDMVLQAKLRGAKTIILDAGTLLDAD